MATRPYRSPRRTASAAQTRERIIAAAASELNGKSEAFSLEATAKTAGVTRLTVYHQFGSRRGLLEAVFDDRAERAGMFRLAEAMADSDSRNGLRKLIAIFCDFWSFDIEAIRRLYAECASDPELADAVEARNERRRRALSVLVSRIVNARAKQPAKLDELVDVLTALTSFAFFTELVARGRPTDTACSIIQSMAADAITRFIPS